MKAGDEYEHRHGKLVHARHWGITRGAERGVRQMGYSFGKLTKFYAKKAQRKREHETLVALLDEAVGKEICA